VSVFICANEADSFQLSNLAYRLLTELACARARPEDCRVLQSHDAAGLHFFDSNRALRLAALLDYAAMRQIAIWQAKGTEDSLGGARHLEEFRRFLARHLGDLRTVDAFDSDRSERHDVHAAREAVMSQGQPPVWPVGSYVARVRRRLIRNRLDGRRPSDRRSRGSGGGLDAPVFIEIFGGCSGPTCSNMNAFAGQLAWHWSKGPAQGLPLVIDTTEMSRAQLAQVQRFLQGRDQELASRLVYVVGD
jgi:hypothetical protein